MKYGRILLLVLAVAVLAAVGSELGRGADVARSAPAAATDISLDNVTILGADLDGNENTIEIPMSGNTLEIPETVLSARIVKEVTITVPGAMTVRVSGEFAPPNYTVWHCPFPFVAGASALSDRGCTAGSHYYTLVGGPPFRGQPMCQWAFTTETGVAPKVVMPWAGLLGEKCERFGDESSTARVGPAFQAGGGAPGCRIWEVTAPAWAPAGFPFPYDLGNCILDWHGYAVVAQPGPKTFRVVDQLELKPADIPPGTYNMSEDFEVMPVGDTDPNLNNNTLTKSFQINIVSGPPVGGLAELPSVAGSSGHNYVLLAGLAAAAACALGVGAWYARRRWVR